MKNSKVGKIMSENQEILINILNLKEDIENHINTNKLSLSPTFIQTITINNDTLDLLKNITQAASASIGLDIHENLSDHYDTSYTTWNRIKYWDEHTKEKVKNIIIEKIRAVKATKKVDKFFFFENEKPSKELREKALSLHKIIAECAINYTFENAESVKPNLQSKAFEALLQLSELPSTLQTNDNITLRNLISTRRFCDISKKEKEPSLSILAMKAVARNWYQKSNKDFLDHKSGYHNITYVDDYLYILTSKQLEQLRLEFLEEAKQKYEELKAKKWDHDTYSSVNFLIDNTKLILSWNVEE